MNDPNETGGNGQTQSLDSRVERIHKYCGGVDEDILFTKETAEVSTTEHKANHAANAIYLGLLSTLDERAEEAAEQVKQGDPLAKDHGKIVQGIETMAQVARALADNKVVIPRNLNYERKRRNLGDMIYSYRWGDFTIDNTAYKDLRILIRPKPFHPSAEVERSVGRRDVYDQARMQITLVPRFSPFQELTMRIDEEDLERDFMITYDLIFGTRDEDFGKHIDLVSLAKGKQPVHLQREGHHYPSAYKARELGVTFADILEAYNRKLANPASQPPEQSS